MSKKLKRKRKAKGYKHFKNTMNNIMSGRATRFGSGHTKDRGMFK